MPRDSLKGMERLAKSLTEKSVSAVRHLTQLGKVCRINLHNGENRFEFHHDRILEYFLGDVLYEFLGNEKEHMDVLTDPYFILLLGRVLVADRVSVETLSLVRAHLPIALVGSIRYLRSSGKNNSAITEAAREWLTGAAADRKTLRSILFEAYWLLEGADSSAVLSVTEELREHVLLARARLANGDATSGAVGFAKEHMFSPSVTDHGLDTVIARALHRYKPTLIAGCKELLQKPDQDEQLRKGAFTLAGFIEDPQLAQSVTSGWELARDKDNALIPALWADFRCCSDDPATSLGPMLSHWGSLSDEEVHPGISARAIIAEELHFAMRRGIPGAVLCYLTEFAKTNPDIGWPITYMLDQVVEPVVIRHLVEKAADIELRNKGKETFSPWLLTFRDNWDPMSPRGRRLPPAGVACLRSCWESDEAEPHVRETAFRFWVRTACNSAELWNIPESHPQFRTVLWRRAKLGDETAVPLIKALLATDDEWFHVIDKVWCRTFYEDVDRALAKLVGNSSPEHSKRDTNDHYTLSHLLRDIPVEDAEPLLQKHWDHLKCSARFVHLSLYLGTERCLELAAEAIRDWPGSSNVFEHVGFFFGFNTSGLRDRLGRAHLESLRPYLSQIPDSDLGRLAEFCQKQGHHDWLILHLRDEFEDRRKKLSGEENDTKSTILREAQRLFPSDQDLMARLNWIEQQPQPEGHLWQWCEEFNSRRDNRERWRSLLEEWLVDSPTLARYRMLARAVSEHGTRHDLEWLTLWRIDETEESLHALEDARFAVMRRSLS